MPGLKARDVAAMLREAGFPQEIPVSLAAWGPDGMVFRVAAGTWPSGRAVSADDLFYGASLAKQVTGAAVALLVRQNRLDPDMPILGIISGLPAWANAVTVRQLLHHTGGLPAAGLVEASLGDRHWTNDDAIAALQALEALPSPPGTTFAYSNLGYICLGRIVEFTSGLPLGEFIARNLLAPLSIAAMRLPPAGERPDYPQVAGMGPSLPLSTGDGGLWTNAAAFALWLDRQNRDTLGVAGLVEAAGRLPDGRSTGYGWGIGIREFHGSPLFIHAGGWRGAYCKAVRCPALGLSLAAFAADHSAERILAVTDALFARLAG